MRAAVVLTTIHDCSKLITALYDNLRFYEHLGEVELIIIPDVKTPVQPRDTCDELRLHGFQSRWFNLEEQDQFIRSLDVLPDFIKRNSDHRRNVGYLFALAEGFDFVISLDDDNYPMPQYDFFREHSIVCEGPGHYNLSTDNWYNVCELLVIDDYPDRYVRGFPYFARTGKKADTRWFDMAKVRINEGLWQGEPDFDAITWLAAPCKSDAIIDHVVMGRNTWAPINSQNTAVHRDLIPAYYFARSLRYGDIMQGYLVQAVAKKMGWVARFGAPVVDHRRNSHNYLADVAAEINDIQILEELLPRLTSWDLKGSIVSDIYLDLAELIRARGLQFIADDMKTWTNMCKQIGVTA